MLNQKEIILNEDDLLYSMCNLRDIRKSKSSHNITLIAQRPKKLHRRFIYCLLFSMMKYFKTGRKTYLQQIKHYIAIQLLSRNLVHNKQASHTCKAELFLDFKTFSFFL